ncbi:MAG: DUF6364 family protein [Archaeoglobaceae archaeon]
MKVKVTLSLKEELVKRVKSRLLMEDKTLSELVEEYLAIYDGFKILDAICDKFGMSKRLLSGLEVELDRERGLKAEEVLREIRNERNCLS